MRAKASAQLDDLRKSIAAVESDDDATRSSSGGGSSQTANRHHQQQIDLSVLRKPILTAVTGFLEAHKAYEAGTEEIRKLLTSECDVLYECRVCRNLFRSLTNFISHKRVYCRKLFNVAQHFHFQNDGFLDQDLSTILQAEQDSQRKAKKVHADILNKDLSSIIERLRRKQHKISSDLSLTDYYDRVNHKLTQDDLNRQQHLLQLDRVPNSSAAVYQTVRGLASNGGDSAANSMPDSMSAQVGELEAMTDRTRTVLGPDGKVMSQRSQLPVICDRSNRYFQPIEEGEGQEKKKVASHTCSECNLQFDTDQTLRLHQEMKHTPSTYVYTCPSCSRTFLQPAAVIRHLSNDHKKSMRRIKMMRDSIFKRRTRVDEVVVKGPSSREMSRLLNASSSSSSKDASSSGSSSFSTGNGFLNNSATNGSRISADDEAAATRAWMENLEHFDQGPMCSYCGKTFDRKAVLATHMQTCVQKIRQTENGAGSVPPISGRRSKVKDEQLPPPPPPAPVATAVKIKQEVVDASDDSNSYDVPLATLQARMSDCSGNTVVTVKPEELAGEESRSRRKRQKPTIMLRNANDDISWEDPEEAPLVVTEEVQIKQEPMEEEESTPAPTVSTGKVVKPRAPRNRKKKTGNEPDQEPVVVLGDKELAERIEADGEVVCRCAKRYSDPERYKHHLRVFHSRQRRFWCAICDFKGYRKVDTINHLMQEHGYKGDAEDIGSLINFQPPEEKCKKKPTSQSQPQSQSQPNNSSSSNQPASTSPPPAQPPVQSLISSVIDAVTRQRNLGDSSADISLLETTSDSGATAAMDGSPRKRGRPRGFRESICLGSVEELGKRVKVEVLEEPRSPTRRPIRNRVKPVDKDFVYDLTHLLHKEEDLDDFPLPELVQEKVPVLLPPPPPAPPTFGRSRSESSRNSCSSSVSSTPEKKEPPTTPSKKESLRSHAPKPKPAVDPALYRGAALAMAKVQVEAGRAAFHRPPSIPQERPFVPSRMSPPKQLQPPSSNSSSAMPRKVATQQQTLHDWPVVKKERRIGSIAKNASDIQIKRRYLKRAAAAAQLQLPQLIREQRKAIPRRNSVVPLTQRLSATVEILNKLNASRSAEGLELVRVTELPSSMTVRCPTAAEFKRYIEANLKDHRERMAQVNLNGTTVEDLSGVVVKKEKEEETVKVKEEKNEAVVKEPSASPRKRITMLQRMEENRTKRMQEQNGSPPDIKPQLPAAAATSTVSPSSSSASSTSSPAANQITTSSSFTGSSSTTTNVTDMLHAKLKRFSSL